MLTRPISQGAAIPFDDEIKGSSLVCAIVPVGGIPGDQALAITLANPAAAGSGTAIQSAGIVYVSAPVDSNGSLCVRGGIKEQAIYRFRQIELCLQKAGGSRDSIVRITAYLRNMDDYSGYREARTEFFKGLIPPASVALGIDDLYAEDWLVEIEAMAVL